ncbi:MAG TPA: hypothetical protein ENO08_03410 [Candidatus Eisenbacteria bacterium]|uniref:Uncharacterized protein n=1 Tax=Eiseniibacteriota bacterium TaxID=2212470 RepID=A0A7V2F366_UNCEI|nr:hypothetical protein [Candidatus Eisenbacteria bacterium]
MKKNHMILAITVVVAAAILALVLSRGMLRERIYRKSGERLAERFSPEIKAKYMHDYLYTIDKFWEFYEKGIVNQNDLTDVTAKMNYLREKETVRDGDIFDFISYVSRIYTDAMNRYHEEQYRQRIPDTLRIELSPE